MTHEEANILLAALQEKSPILNDMALLSLHSGLRAGEVFSLTWADIDMARESIFIRDPKSGRNRHAYTTDAVKDILSNRKKEKDSQLVQGIARSFANKHDRTIQLPPARDLQGAVKILEQGITTSRQKETDRVKAGQEEAGQIVKFTK